MATMYFAHTLSACLGFAAFACLFLRCDSVPAALGAGVLAGLAVTMELPLVLAAVALGGYALWRSGSAACAVFGGSSGGDSALARLRRVGVRNLPSRSRMPTLSPCRA